MRDIITLLTFFWLNQGISYIAVRVIQWRISAAHARPSKKFNISKKSNMILKSLIYTDWKRFLIIMT